LFIISYCCGLSSQGREAAREPQAAEHNYGSNILKNSLFCTLCKQTTKYCRDRRHHTSTAVCYKKQLVLKTLQENNQTKVLQRSCMLQIQTAPHKYSSVLEIIVEKLHATDTDGTTQVQQYVMKTSFFGRSAGKQTNKILQGSCIPKTASHNYGDMQL